MAHCEEMAASGADTICKSKGIKSIRQRETIKELQGEIRALRTRAEEAERERDEAYAKGQRDKQGECAEVIRQHLWKQGYILRADAAAELLMSLPIKERP